jgi:hypothetical protein
MVRTVAVSVALTLVLLAACTYESGSENADDPTTTTSTTLVPTTGGVTTLPPATTTPPADCPGTAPPGPPAGASDLSEGLADVDGNGSEDLIQAYAVPAFPPWRLRVLLDTGFAAELTLDQPTDAGVQAQAVGGADLGGGAAEELLVSIGASSSTTSVALFRFRDCHIERITDQAGHQFTLSIGGSIREGYGLECGEGQFVTLHAKTTDGRAYEVDRAVNRIDGGTLLAEAPRPAGTLIRPADDNLIRLYYRLNCGTLGLAPLSRDPTG